MRSEEFKFPEVSIFSYVEIAIFILILYDVDRRCGRFNDQFEFSENLKIPKNISDYIGMILTVIVIHK